MSWNRLIYGCLGLAGAVLLALPASAARLQSWQFDQRQNRLTFTTDSQVRPRAQLLFNPTRLVIDLPATTLARAAADQSLGNGIRAIRVAQFDPQTVRLVIEFEPGYAVDPQQVQVRGQTEQQWYVQLPVLQSSGEPSSVATPTATDNVVNSQTVTGASTQIQGIVATADGFFIRTLGELPEVDVSRQQPRNGRRQIRMRFGNAAIAPNLTAANLPSNRYAVPRWEITQVTTSPPVVEVVMTLGDDSPDWRTITSNLGSNLGGVVILPAGVAIREVPDSGDQTAAGQIVAVPTPPSQPQVIPPPRPLPPVADPPAAGELPTVPTGQYVVVLDPGHGGRDPGAVGIGGLQEKQVVNPMTQEVATLLRQQGVTVITTRDQDIELGLDTRVQIANRANADLFVSIHANAINLSRPDVNGLETFYYSDSGARFARTVHDIVLSDIDIRDRRIRQARFYVIRHTDMPAILIETGFVTGAEDIVNLRDPTWRSRMARAIARGILTHLQQGL